MRRSARLALLAALLSRPAAAHQGPPFPILVDQKAGPWIASVWTDPDIGTGIFYVLLDENAPAPAEVRIAVQPVTGRLPEAVHDAEAQPTRQGLRFYAEVPFDAGGHWRVRVMLTGPAGSGELISQVEPTPDGTLGPLELVLYLLPFLAVGFLWTKAVLRRRLAQRREASPATTSSEVSSRDGRCPSRHRQSG